MEACEKKKVEGAKDNIVVDFKTEYDIRKIAQVLRRCKPALVASFRREIEGLTEGQRNLHLL